MEVGPVDWTKFVAAMEWGKGLAAAGRSSGRVFRGEHESDRVLIVEEWESHDAMHAYQDKYGDEFNRRAGTEGLDWSVSTWMLAGAMD
jgi:hypothetical protein